MNLHHDTVPIPMLSASDPLSHSAPAVLCVDDDPNISEALARRFRRSGVRVIRAYDGMQGCWLAVTEKPRVIVLDVAMPKGNGLEILEWLKRNRQTAHIPVFVLTGRADEALRHRMELLGAERFFHKPTPFESLLEEVRDLL